MKKPLEFEIAGKAIKIAPQNIAGVLLILLAVGYQFSNRGGMTKVSLPEAANQKLIGDLQSISEAGKEEAKAETQFAGLMPENVDLAAVHSTGTEAIASANALHAGSQLALLAFVEERKEEIIKGMNAERNNPKNEACFATEWKDAKCLQSLLQNRKLQWEAAHGTPSREDDLAVIYEQMAFSLAIQEVIAEPLGVEADLLKVYDAQLSNGNLTIDSAKAFAGIFNLSNQAQEALAKVQVANDGAISSISNRTQSQNDCLNNGVINTETAKKCGVKPE